MNNNAIRITGTETFVKTAGDTILSLIVGNHEVDDGGVKESRNPKYKGNYIRYIRVGKEKTKN